MADDAEQRARAERRRATYEGHVVRSGEAKPALYAGKSLLERWELQAELVRRQAAMAGIPVKKVPRSEWPGEVFDIGERNRRAREESLADVDWLERHPEGE